MILGITGKIGSGKHTAARCLEKQGFFLIDVDKIAHELYVNGSDIWYKLVDVFGNIILDEKSQIDRLKLGLLVFADSNKLDQLNAIVHPKLKQLIQTKITQAINKKEKKIVVLAALANELNLKSFVDTVLLITAPIQKRIQWLKKSRKISEKNVLLRNKVQKNIKHFDYKILNNESFVEFEKQVLIFVP